MNLSRPTSTNPLSPNVAPIAKVIERARAAMTRASRHAKGLAARHAKIAPKPPPRDLEDWLRDTREEFL